MKPDNKKRRKGKRRPDNYYRDWEQRHKLRAKQFKADLKAVKGWADEFLKDVSGSACLRSP